MTSSIKKWRVEHFMEGGKLLSRQSNWAWEISEGSLKPSSSWDFHMLPSTFSFFPMEPSLHTNMDTGGHVVSLKPDSPILIPVPVGPYTPSAKEGHWMAYIFDASRSSLSPPEGFFLCGEAVSPPPHYGPTYCSLVSFSLDLSWAQGTHLILPLWQMHSPLMPKWPDLPDN